MCQRESIGVRERAVKICAIAGLMPQASSLLDGLLNEGSGYTPPSVSFLPVLNAYRKLRRTGKIEEYLDKITNAYRSYNSSDILDVYPLNIYIGALCDTKQFHKALDLLQPGVSMQRFGVDADLVSFNTVLSSSIRRGELKIANAAADLLIESGLSKDIYTYNALIRVANKSRNRRRALSLIDQVISSEKMKGDKYFVDNALVPLLDADRFVDAMNLLNSLDVEKHPDKASDTFSALLLTLCKSERHLGTAKFVLETFILYDSSSKKADPITRHFNIILDGYKRTGQYSLAVALIKTMMRNDVKPDGKMDGL